MCILGKRNQGQRCTHAIRSTNTLGNNEKGQTKCDLLTATQVKREKEKTSGNNDINVSLCSTSPSFVKC